MVSATRVGMMKEIKRGKKIVVTVLSCFSHQLGERHFAEWSGRCLYGPGGPLHDEHLQFDRTLQLGWNAPAGIGESAEHSPGMHSQHWANEQWKWFSGWCVPEQQQHSDAAESDIHD